MQPAVSAVYDAFTAILRVGYKSQVGDDALGRAERDDWSRSASRLFRMRGILQLCVSWLLIALISCASNNAIHTRCKRYLPRDKTVVGSGSKNSSETRVTATKDSRRQCLSHERRFCLCGLWSLSLIYVCMYRALEKACETSSLSLSLSLTVFMCDVACNAK